MIKKKKEGIKALQISIKYISFRIKSKTTNKGIGSSVTDIFMVLALITLLKKTRLTRWPRRL